MTLSDILSNIPWWLIVIVVIGLAMKANYYSSGADDEYEKRKSEYESKMANKPKPVETPKAITAEPSVVEETTTTTTTTSTTRKMGDWSDLSGESMKEDSRVKYTDPVPEEGNLDNRGGDSEELN